MIIVHILVGKRGGLTASNVEICWINVLFAKTWSQTASIRPTGALEHTPFCCRGHGPSIATTGIM